MQPGASAVLANDSDQRVAPSPAARGKKLHDQRIRVAVGDKAREPVRLSVHKSQRIGRFRWNYCAPERERGFDSLSEQVRARDSRLLEAPDAGPDLRGRAVRRPGEETAVVASDIHGIPAALRSPDLS